MDVEARRFTRKRGPFWVTFVGTRLSKITLPFWLWKWTIYKRRER